MIRIDDAYSIDVDAHNFILHHTYVGKGKDGTQKRQTRQTYHRTLEQDSRVGPTMRRDTQDALGFVGLQCLLAVR